MKIFLTFIVFAISIGLNAQTGTVQTRGMKRSSGEETIKKVNYTYFIIPSVNKTWGYNIFMEKRLLIHQASVPGLPGNEGFKTKVDAGKVARLVIEKIQKGEMPPSVTIEELKKLKVL